VLGGLSPNIPRDHGAYLSILQAGSGRRSQITIIPIQPEGCNDYPENEKP